MQKLLFLAPYPKDNTIQDGYFQRIKNIDNLFIDVKREYLQISVRLSIKDEVYCSDNVEVYNLNIFRNFFKILKIIRNSTHIYIHSIYRYFPAYIFFKKEQFIILDYHGIVPEEILFFGKRIKSFFYNLVERNAINRVNKIVVVTYAMKDFIINKYKNKTIDFIYYPIVTKNVLSQNPKGEIKKQDDEVVFVYSGNCQKWQRIDSIIDFINLHSNIHYTFYLLTRDKDNMRTIVNKKLHKDNKSKIVIETVSPEKLCEYYSIANYGFLIRDHHPLNLVANPTKMLEYMYYNLRIVVDLVEIGDYRNYDYVRFDSEEISIIPEKSTINKEIALKLLNSRNDDLRKCVLGYKKDR